MQTALDQVRQRSGGSGSSALLAQVGNWLKTFGIEPKRLPAPLSVILRSMPAFCRVEGDRVFFLPGSAELSWSTGSPPENEATKLSETEGTRWIRPDLWTALVKFREGLGHYLDLETLQVTAVTMNAGEPGSPVVDDPIRYVRIPTIPTAEQQAPLRPLLADSLPLEKIEALFSSPGWSRRLHEELPPPLSRAVEAERRRRVLECAQAFLGEHNIPLRGFLRQGGPSSAMASQTSGSHEVSERDVSGRQSLRQMLHTCIDVMSEEELGLVQLPARVLLRIK